MAAVSNDFAGVSIAPAFWNLPVETIATMASKPAPPDVLVLTAQMSRGDEAAFHEFHRRYFNRLLRYLIVVTNGREETAREALQLACVRVARHVRKFDSEPAFWNWLAMLARNCAVDEMRKQSRHRSLLARFLQQRPADANLAGSDADERFSELVREELAKLPGDERALLERKYLDGEAARTLAGEWQMTEKAMESHLLRLRRKLKNRVLDRLRHETND